MLARDDGTQRYRSTNREQGNNQNVKQKKALNVIRKGLQPLKTLISECFLVYSGEGQI